jgi:hypothetical protein
MFGLVPGEGNHGEDVKEYYFYLDATPTNSYLKALYKYPQRAYPYEQLIQENQCRGKDQPEYELMDTGIFNENRYFDIVVEYAKNSPNDILIRLSLVNRGPEKASLDVLPTLWFRNTWSSKNPYEDWPKPEIIQSGESELITHHQTLGPMRLQVYSNPLNDPPIFLFTENETNYERIFNYPNQSPYVKDAFNEYIVHGKKDAVNPNHIGTKAAAYYSLEIPPDETAVFRLRLFAEEENPQDPQGETFDAIFNQRIAEAEKFFQEIIPKDICSTSRNIIRQAYAGLLWNRQFYYYIVKDWINGDPEQLPPPEQRKLGRNHTWQHIFDRNFLSIPDNWEFPWFAAWDTGFQMIPFAAIDPDFAKAQLVLLLREWYMNPNGQLPAYEFSFSEVNPPIHAWASRRVYEITGSPGHYDRAFLESTFQKLLLNFTWWVNRKDIEGRQIFSGGFLGMDNIGIFDRGKFEASGLSLEQADGTAWMAFFCLNMLTIALELAKDDSAYEDMASKFFTHFTGISDAINNLGGSGLWDNDDGFYYDQAIFEGQPIRLRIRSLVGLIPLIAVAVLDYSEISKLSGFMKRMEWFLEHRKDIAHHIAFMCKGQQDFCRTSRLLAIPCQGRLEQVLQYMLDENEFLSPYGIRSLSLYHKDHPFTLEKYGQAYHIDYEPGESTTDLYGGNSNWRGPIWLPINYLIIEALEKYYDFYGDSLRVECPTRSGNWMNLDQVAKELKSRLARIFLSDKTGNAPWHGEMTVFSEDPFWNRLLLFNEYFHGDTGKGLGASHQTGWTALIACLLSSMSSTR